MSFCSTPTQKTFRGHPARKFKLQSVPPIHKPHVISSSSRVSSLQGHQLDAAACLLTQIEQPPTLTSATCQICKNASVKGSDIYCQSCQALYLAVSPSSLLVLPGHVLTLEILIQIQQEPELQQAFLNLLPQSIRSAPPQSVPNAYLHHSLNSAAVHPQYSTPYPHNNGQVSVPNSHLRVIGLV